MPRPFAGYLSLVKGKRVSARQLTSQLGAITRLHRRKAHWDFPLIYGVPKQLPSKYPQSLEMKLESIFEVLSTSLVQFAGTNTPH